MASPEQSITSFLTPRSSQDHSLPRWGPLLWNWTSDCWSLARDRQRFWVEEILTYLHIHPLFTGSLPWRNTHYDKQWWLLTLICITLDLLLFTKQLCLHHSFLTDEDETQALREEMTYSSISGRVKPQMQVFQFWLQASVGAQYTGFFPPLGPSAWTLEELAAHHCWLLFGVVATQTEVEAT